MKTNKKIIVLCLGIVLLISSISFFGLANNETENTNRGEIANCSEQLKICIDEYNSLLEDYKEGNNCGNAFLVLKEFNKVLTEERDSCREEIEKIKNYRIGFYILLILLIITSLIIIVSGVIKNKHK